MWFYIRCGLTLDVAILTVIVLLFMLMNDGASCHFCLMVECLTNAMLINHLYYVIQSVGRHKTFPSLRKISSIGILGNLWYCLQGFSMVTL